MKSSRRKWSMMLGLGAILALSGTALADNPLNIGGSSANYGVHRLQAGFMPDPKTVSVVSGGSLDSSSMGLGAGCTGYVTANPDAILHYNGTPSTGLLRIFVQAQGNADTTLIINGPNGQWYCNDDAFGRNPEITFNSPGSGQYDIWVGSYEAGRNLRGQLNITERGDRHARP